jgi:hypothetical protein
VRNPARADGSRVSASPAQVGFHAENAEGAHGSLREVAVVLTVTKPVRHTRRRDAVNPTSGMNVGELVPVLWHGGPWGVEKNPEGQARAEGREGPTEANRVVATNRTPDNA